MSKEDWVKELVESFEEKIAEKVDEIFSGVEFDVEIKEVSVNITAEIDGVCIPLFKREEE